MNKKRINQDKINEIEIQSFIKYYRIWCKDPDGMDEFRAMLFYQNFLKGFLKNRSTTRIVGADKARGFEMNIAGVSGYDQESYEKLQKICKDIWEHPENYYELMEDEDSYYDFLKYLWVIRDGDEDNARQLADIACPQEMTEEESLEDFMKIKFK